MAKDPVRPTNLMVGKNLTKVRKGLMEESFLLKRVFCLEREDEEISFFLS